MNWLFTFIANLFRPKHHSFNYIPPQDLSYKSGWQKVDHPPQWVLNKLSNVPDYNPEQGIHYFPYCRGHHFEYCYTGDIYRRRIRKH